MNKKAQSQFNIFSFMIIAFLVVVFFGGLIYTMGKINDVFTEVGIANEKHSGNEMWVNMTQASEHIFGQLNTSIQSLKLVAIVYILGLGVVIIVTNALMRIHPLFFFAYILIALLAVIFAPTISNAYETLLESNIFEGTLAGFSASNFLLLNLPSVVMIVSVLGGVFLFINLIRTGGEETLR